MKNIFKVGVMAVVAASFTGEAIAETTWNVSLWGKRRAFTEHVEKLAELVSEKTNGEMKLNISYGGLSKNKENLDGISIGAFEMAQFCAGYHRDKNPSITSPSFSHIEENNSSVPLLLIASFEKFVCMPEPFQSPVFGFG